MKNAAATASSASKTAKISLSSDYLQTIYQRLSLATVLIPALGTVVAIALLWVTPIGYSELALFLTFYLLTVLGIEVGYHRLFSHRSFQTTRPIQALLAILGSMAAQGGVIFWVAHHRRHHQYTDQCGDPHSPHLQGEERWSALKGLWHAQAGWVLEGEITNSAVFAKDLIRDPLITTINRLQQVWVLAGLLIPAIVNGWIVGTWTGAGLGLLWGGLVRIFVGQQIVNATNSICHWYGARPFRSEDKSTNNGWLAIPSLGQSWHNNHHAFPNSAIAGLQWWQIDISTWVIRVLERLGWATGVKTPSAEIQAAKQIGSTQLDC
jgi:stearoyl-CoA desaturase (Delta-9 desaturase)